MIELLAGMQNARKVTEEQFVFDERHDRGTRRRRQERSSIRRLSFLRRTLRPRREPARSSELGRADAC
jgi:hypothetical protein